LSAERALLTIIGVAVAFVTLLFIGIRMRSSPSPKPCSQRKLMQAI
jgi:hypothetical protein